MTVGPDDVHVLLGAYVLGGLSDDDHRAFSEHLRGCERCQSELGQLSGLPRLLDLAAPDGGPHLNEAPGGARGQLPIDDDGARVSTLLVEAARRRRRRRTVLSALAAVASVLLFAGGVWLGPHLLSPEEPSSPATHVAAAASPGSSVTADVSLVARKWGTQLDLSCSDMPSDGTLLLWVVDRQGRGSAAATWLATASSYAHVTGATSLRPEQIQRLEVRTGSGRVLATART
jgi:hypothetical protein